MRKKDWNVSHHVWLMSVTFMFCSCCCFRLHGCTNKHTVLPIKCLVHQRHSFRSSATKNNCLNWNTFGAFPLVVHYRTLWCRSAETGIRMSGWFVHAFVPVFDTEPWRYGYIVFHFFLHAFPKDPTVARAGNVGEDRVLQYSSHGIWIGLHGGTWNMAWQGYFKVNG